VLNVDTVTKTYRSRAVLDRVTLQAEPGAVTGLLGPNGAGKTTLVHLIAGLARATSGRITIDGEPVRSAVVRRAIGFCPDDLPMPDLLTAREYLALVQGARRIAPSAVGIRMMADGLRIGRHLDALVGTFSHGMKRKLQLVAALLHAPRVLLLDEPFRGLDPESSTIMRALVSRYAEAGNLVLVSTHDLALAQRLCGRVVVLGDGAVRAAGDVASVVGGHRDLEASFLARTGLDADLERATVQFFLGLDLVSGRRA
jgi:ABC-2 type transport system ATP-binding protein